MSKSPAVSKLFAALRARCGYRLLGLADLTQPFGRTPVLDFARLHRRRNEVAWWKRRELGRPTSPPNRDDATPGPTRVSLLPGPAKRPRISLKTPAEGR